MDPESAESEPQPAPEVGTQAPVTSTRLTEYEYFALYEHPDHTFPTAE